MSKMQKIDLLDETFNPFNSPISQEELMENLEDLDKGNIRAKFKNTQDPINLAFEAIEKTSLKTLAKDFVKESFYDFVSFITDVCK